MHPEPPHQTFAEAKAHTMDRVAQTIEGYMKRRKQSVPDFNVSVLKVDPRNTAVYGWLGRRNLPSPKYIPALCSALHVGRWYFVPKAIPPTGSRSGAARMPDPPVDGPQGVNGGQGSLPLTEEEQLEQVFRAPQEDAAEPASAKPRRAPRRPTVPRYAPPPHANGHNGTAKAATADSLREALACTVNGDGTATIRMVHTIAQADAMALFQLLSERGIGLAKKDGP